MVACYDGEVKQTRDTHLGWGRVVGEGRGAGGEKVALLFSTKTY